MTASSATDLFHAARTGDVAAVREYLAAGDSVAAENAQGFTALECAAMGSGQTALADSLAILRLLVDAGSPLEHRGLGGRTALYLAAEFAHGVGPVQLLAEAGAAVDICDSHGNHVVRVFAMTVIANLSKQHPDLKTELKLVIEDQLPFGTPAYLSRSKKILKQLEK